MALQDIRAIILAGEAGRGTTSLAGRSHHGAHPRIEQLRSYTQPDGSVFGSWNNGGNNDSLPCSPSSQRTSCWTTLLCSAAAQAQQNPSVLTSLCDRDQKICQELREAFNDCEHSDLLSLILNSVGAITQDTVDFLAYVAMIAAHNASLSASTSLSSPKQAHVSGATSASNLTTSLPTSGAKSAISSAPSTSGGGSDDIGVSESVISQSPPSGRTATSGATLVSPGPSPPASAPFPSLTSPTPSSSLTSPTGDPSSGASPMPPGPHAPNIGAIIGIVLAALALLLCIVLALIFLLRRRARTRAKRTSRGGPWQRLKPHVYDDASSGTDSSVWTWFGSVPIDSDYEPKPVSRPHTPDSQTTSAAGPFPCPSQTPSEDHPSVVAASCPQTRSLHDGSRYLTVSASSTQSVAAVASSKQLLALARTEFEVAIAADRGGWRLERVASGVSRTTASSGNVDSVEAM